MRETNNRRHIDSGVKCGGHYFGDGSGVVIVAWWIKLIVCMAAYIAIGASFSGDVFQWYHSLTFYIIGAIAAAK